MTGGGENDEREARGKERDNGEREMREGE